jgi:hypothetical protein
MRALVEAFLAAVLVAAVASAAGEDEPEPGAPAGATAETPAEAETEAPSTAELFFATGGPPSEPGEAAAGGVARLHREKRFAVNMLLDATVKSDVSREEFDAFGAEVVWTLGAGEKTPEAVRNYVELSAGYVESLVNYTNGFIALLDQGGASAFSEQAQEVRTHVSVTAVSRFTAKKNLDGGGLSAFLLWGARYMRLKGEMIGSHATVNDLDKEAAGLELGLRASWRRNTERLSHELSGEYRFLDSSLMDSGRVESGSDYLAPVGSAERLAFAYSFGKIDRNFKVELAYLVEWTESGGTFDDDRSYQGFRVGLVYDF